MVQLEQKHNLPDKFSHVELVLVLQLQVLSVANVNILVSEHRTRITNILTEVLRAGETSVRELVGGLNVALVAQASGLEREEYHLWIAKVE